MAIRYVHLHGFASSGRSVKGQKLADALREHGALLETPDIDRPSFATLTYTACLAHLDAMLADAPRVRMSGSSMGGWLAARWAQLNPTKVERLLLLCPGFDLQSRWPAILGAETMLRWEREGALPMPDRDGDEVPVHWNFIVDARRHPPVPEVPCPTVIVHGRRDTIVPIDGSRAYAADRAHVRLIEVDDVHTLEHSAELLQRVAVEHLLSQDEGS